MRWTIRRKLLATFGTLVAFVAILGGVAYDRIDAVGTLGQDIAHHDRTAFLATRMKVELLEARRREKDFFLRDADPQYLREHAEHVTAFLTASSQLADRSEDSELTAKSRTTQEMIRQYGDAFRRAAAARMERGTTEDGRMGSLRRAAHQLEEILVSENSDALRVRILTLRRHEKDFLLRDDDEYARRLRTEVHATRQALEERISDAGLRGRVETLLEDYSQSFDEVVANTRTMRQEQEDFRSAAHGIEPVVESIATEAVERSLALQDTIEGQRESAIAVVLALVLVLLVLSMTIARVLSTQIARSVHALLEGAQRIATGDLSQTVTVPYEDEFGTLAKGFDEMRRSLIAIMASFGQAAESLTDLSVELSSATREQSAGMHQQAAAVAETQATVEEIASAASQVAGRSEQVVSTASASLHASQRGTDSLERAVGAMASIRDQVQSIATTILDLSQKTQQIGTIIATVNDIAEQSNLLALNASIEAARAGEQGRAFAVVAGEVRSLAERSQRATGQVRTILGDIQQTTNTAVMVTEEGGKRVERGIDLVATAKDVIGELLGVIEEASRIAEQIAASTGQQAAGVQQISASMADITKFSEQSVSAIQQIDTSASTLVELGDRFKREVAKYRYA